MKENLLGLQEVKYSIGQKASGIWRCDEISFYCTDPVLGIEILEHLITLMEDMLSKKNQVINK